MLRTSRVVYYKTRPEGSNASWAANPRTKKQTPRKAGFLILPMCCLSHHALLTWALYTAATYPEGEWQLAQVQARIAR